MASISCDRRGCRILQFVLDGKRRSIRLGKMTAKDAETFCARVGELISARLSGLPPKDVASLWIRELDHAMAARLADVGLVGKRPTATLKGFLDEFIESHKTWKPGTREKYELTRDELVDFFGADRLLRDITPGDADRFRRHLKGVKKQARNTYHRTCGRCKTAFREAVQLKLLYENPFGHQKTTTKGNRDRDRFVTREEIQQVIDACPDAQWRLIFALCRFGGVRCPSEVLALKWEHVLWEQEKLFVPSPKTEHHEGKGHRIIPLFPELRPYLDEAHEVAATGAVFVITRYRRPDANLGTEAKRIMARAGVEPWAKPFVNLRSTRETELSETYPPHVVCAWIGNSQEVAKEHYLQVTAEHFAKAVVRPEAGAESSAAPPEKCSAPSRALQKALQQPSAGDFLDFSGRKPDPGDSHQARLLQAFATICEIMREGAEGQDLVSAPPVGLEPTT